MLDSVVTGRSGDRPRAVWRLLIPFVLVVGIGIGLTVVLTTAIPAELQENLALGVVGDVVLALVVLAVVYLSARHIDRRAIDEYGFHLSGRWWADFAAGAVAGTLIVAAAFAAGYALGGVAVVDVISAGDAGSFVAGFLLLGVGYAATAFWEETLFRGLFVTNAAEGLAARGLSSGRALLGAWVVSSVVFGAIHAPLSRFPGGTSIAGMLAVWTLMGGLLGLAYVLSGELAFPMGLHFAANYAINSVFFGASGAGGPAPPTVLRTEVAAPEYLHPLGGLPMIGAILLGAVLALGWFRYRDSGLNPAVELATWRADEPAAAEGR